MEDKKVAYILTGGVYRVVCITHIFHILQTYM